MRILLTGASGLLGTPLCQALHERGDELFVVSRNSKSVLDKMPFIQRVIEGNLQQDALRDLEIQHLDAVINLAGDNIASGYWTSKKKKSIYDSRIQLTRNLVASLSNVSGISTWINASATGYYGDRGDELLTEGSFAGRGFLSQVCKDWEQSVSRANTRKVFLRTGIVDSENGGAFVKLRQSLKFGVGVVPGSGKQWVSWIDVRDWVRAVIFILDHPEISGPVNLVGPQPIRMQDLVYELAKKKTYKLVVKAPQFALKLGLGEMSHLLLDSQRVAPEKLLGAGFEFQYSKGV